MKNPDLRTAKKCRSYPHLPGLRRRGKNIPKVEDTVSRTLLSARVLLPNVPDSAADGVEYISLEGVSFDRARSKTEPAEETPKYVNMDEVCKRMDFSPLGEADIPEFHETNSRRTIENKSSARIKSSWRTKYAEWVAPADYTARSRESEELPGVAPCIPKANSAAGTPGRRVSLVNTDIEWEPATPSPKTPRPGHSAESTLPHPCLTEPVATASSFNPFASEGTLDMGDGLLRIDHQLPDTLTYQNLVALVLSFVQRRSIASTTDLRSTLDEVVRLLCVTDEAYMTWCEKFVYHHKYPWKLK